MTIEDVTPEALRGPTDDDRSQQHESMDREITALRDALEMARKDIGRLEERIGDEINARVALITREALDQEFLREGFEEWFSRGDRSNRSVLRSQSGGYLLVQADQAWKAWQASAQFLAGTPC